MGGFGGKALENGWGVDGPQVGAMSGSDAHDPVRRHPRLNEARAEVARRAGEDNAERLFELNPRAIIEGHDVTAIVPMVKAGRRWFLFGR